MALAPTELVAVILDNPPTWIRCAHVAANPESGPNANSGTHGSVAREFCAKQSRSQTNRLQGRPVIQIPKAQNISWNDLVPRCLQRFS